MPKSDAGNSGIALRKRVIDYNYPTHIHDFFEIEYILEGDAVVHMNGTAIPMSQGSVKFCTPLDVEQVEPVTPKVSLVNINFTEDFIEPELLQNITTGFIVNDMSKALVDMLIDEFENDQSYNLLYKKNLLNLILLDTIRKQSANIAINKKGSSSKNNIAQQVALFIHFHYREQLSLKDISAHFSYTHNHLSKIFQSTFNMSITQYLCKTRLEQSEKLLLCSDMNVTQICDECGFPSLSTFFRLFKQHYGISPKEYRKNKS